MSYLFFIDTHVYSVPKKCRTVIELGVVEFEFRFTWRANLINWRQHVMTVACYGFQNNQFYLQFHAVLYVGYRDRFQLI